MTPESVPAPCYFVFGSSHHQASLEVRERLAIAPSKADALYRALLGEARWRECLLLNTCNRIEIYGVANAINGANPQKQVLEYLSRLHGINAEDISDHSFWLTGEDAVRHAFEVAAGLDSQILGETEILGQVKDSYAEAAKVHATGPILNRIFQKSFQVAKWARTHTGIGRGHVSIGNVAAELAGRVCGALSQTSVLLLGTGEVGERTAQALLSRGARSVTVVGRQQDKALALAETLGGAAASFATLPRLLPQADAVIAATASPSAVLAASMVAQAMHLRPERPMFLIDAAMPRDIEPQAQEIPNVYLYNLDDLASLANQNLKARQAEENFARRALADRARALSERLL